MTSGKRVSNSPQAKALMRGGMVLCCQILLRMERASEEIALGPWFGRE